MKPAILLIKFVILLFWVGVGYSFFHPLPLKMKILLYGFTLVILMMHLLLALYLSMSKPRSLELKAKHYWLVIVFGSVQLWQMKDTLMSAWKSELPPSKRRD
ncbi:DUF1145 domain-containing protein [Dongshaea marina]|uniref:DUF1145 domain-containing protein n=1 Tax=Dongshaea marina TaxID=2047966 RepID=UPI000D3E4E17|nr:DUF1145 domain-containing protein [Dongshaea marina]